jgi:hypothetical protein
VRFHDLRHTWGLWRRQAGKTCNGVEGSEKKPRNVMDRYAKSATENLKVAAAGIEPSKQGQRNMAVTFALRSKNDKGPRKRVAL